MVFFCYYVSGSEWVVANADLTVATRMVVGNLTTGDILEMRVVAVNPGGRSEPCALAEAVTVREVGGQFTWNCL